MKRLLSLLLIVPLLVACRKSPPSAAGTAGAGVASPPSAGSASGGDAAGSAAGQPDAIAPVPAELPAILAKVNGEPIERWELESAIRGMEGRAGTPIPPEQRDEVLRGVLDQLIAYRVLAQESRARKLSVSDADVNTSVGQIRQGFPSEEAFRQALTAQGLSFEQLQKQTRVNLEVAKVIAAEVEPKISVQDGEIQAFYQQHLEQFKEDETVHASHILIAVPSTADVAQKQQARATSQQILKQVRGGSDFAKLAREQSQDPGSAANGGDLGFFPKGQMEPTFEATAFTLKPGAVSDVIETPVGFHIIKVHERRAPRTPSLTEISEQIKGFLSERQRDEKVAEFVQQVKAKIKIYVYI